MYAIRLGRVCVCDTFGICGVVLKQEKPQNGKPDKPLLGLPLIQLQNRKKKKNAPLRRWLDGIRRDAAVRPRAQQRLAPGSSGLNASNRVGCGPKNRVTRFLEP